MRARGEPAATSPAAAVRDEELEVKLVFRRGIDVHVLHGARPTLLSWSYSHMYDRRMRHGRASLETGKRAKAADDGVGIAATSFGNSVTYSFLIEVFEAGLSFARQVARKTGFVGKALKRAK